MVDAIEQKLGDNQWLGGQAPGTADREEFDKLKAAPKPATHPNAFAWWCLVSKFNPDIRESWSGGAAAGGAKPAAAEEKKGGKKEKGKKGKKGKEAEVKKPAEDEVDEDDLFGDDDGDDAVSTNWG